MNIERDVWCPFGEVQAVELSRRRNETRDTRQRPDEKKKAEAS
jgi:hypothetical protein